MQGGAGAGSEPLPAPCTQAMSSSAPRPADFSYIPPGRNHLFVPGKGGGRGRGQRARGARSHTVVGLPAGGAGSVCHPPPPTPGPVNIHDKVQRAMQVPSQNHRDPWFPDFFKSVPGGARGRAALRSCSGAPTHPLPPAARRKCLDDTKLLFGTTAGTPFIYPGTGTGGWEAALTNTLSPGDKVVTFRYGLFSHLWIDMMQRLGLDVHVIECRWGDGADEQRCARPRGWGRDAGRVVKCRCWLAMPCRLAEVLAADTEKKIKAVAVVHNETTTGVTSDIPEVGAGRARERGAAQSTARACVFTLVLAPPLPPPNCTPNRCATRWMPRATPRCCWWMASPRSARWTFSLTSGAWTWR